MIFVGKAPYRISLLGGGSDLDWFVKDNNYEFISIVCTDWGKKINRTDNFQVQIDFYKDRYEEEFQAILRDGVEYDEDSSGAVSDSEKNLSII